MTTVKRRTDPPRIGIAGMIEPAKSKPATGDRVTIRLSLRPTPAVADVHLALRLALKRLLRDYGLRAVACHVEAPEPAAVDPGGTS